MEGPTSEAKPQFHWGWNGWWLSIFRNGWPTLPTPIAHVRIAAAGAGGGVGKKPKGCQFLAALLCNSIKFSIMALPLAVVWRASAWPLAWLPLAWLLPLRDRPDRTT